MPEIQDRKRFLWLPMTLSSAIPSTESNIHRLRLLAIFSAQGVVAAMLFMRIPDLQLRAGLSESQLGFILMGGPIGAMATFAIATRLIERFGTRLVTMVSYPVMALSAALLALPTDMVLLFAILLVFGATNSASNIAINVEADRVEAGTGARIMNRCHGVWSVVFFVASLIAGLIRGAGVDPALHLWVLFPLFSVAAIALTWPMREFPERQGGAKSNKFVLPTLAVVALVAFGLGAELLEGASRVWATIYIRDTFDVSAMVESAALPALILAMAGARLVADLLNATEI